MTFICWFGLLTIVYCLVIKAVHGLIIAHDDEPL